LGIDLPVRIILPPIILLNKSTTQHLIV